MFRVEWLQPALDELAALWVEGDSAFRRLVTAASTAIDRELCDNPEEKSESREGEERVFFSYPLGAFFHIDHAASIVWIGHVWDIRRNR